MASAPKKVTSSLLPVDHFQHDDATRKNNPEGGRAARGQLPPQPQKVYAHDPHSAPRLGFNPDGTSDEIFEILERAKQDKLTVAEVAVLLEAVRHHQPWLEWAGKQEQRRTRVNPVSLHTHERVSAKAILKMLAREPEQSGLFADPELDYRRAVQFYQHDVRWSNRLILGDSLEVMTSLGEYEGLAGKVQMIYMDPPYGIKFSSNFQPLIAKRDVKDADSDLTREPEMVRAYRDTWTLGVHSYLTYLRGRLIAARDLLADSGSIFLQISDENVHRIRVLLDEIFGTDNFISQITFQKSGSTTGELLPNTADYVVWYAKDKEKIKFNNLYLVKNAGSSGGQKYNSVELENGLRLPTSQIPEETLEKNILKTLRYDSSVSQGFRSTTSVPFTFRNKTYETGTSKNWKTTLEGMARLGKASRIEPSKDSLNYVRYLEDFPAFSLTSVWTDIGGIQSRDDPKVYVVQTSTTAIQRCMLMTTQPGDLVLDPTCGSGTTAYVAEQWGRRWITVDTSRVALAIARQRILTARFDMYKTCDGSSNPAQNFVYKSVPHITLRSIAQNPHLDPVFNKYEPLLDTALEVLNHALSQVTPDLRKQLEGKLLTFQREQGKRAITGAHKRRWTLPKEKWEHWEVPFDTDPQWPQALQDALTLYRKAWRAKMDEVNKVISDNAEMEELVDQPEVMKGIVRVSGPFTVESVNPLETSLLEDGFTGEDTDLETFDPSSDSQNVEAYQTRMLRALRGDGAIFSSSLKNVFITLEELNSDALHAGGEWMPEGSDPSSVSVRRVAVSFGPEYGPVTVKQVEQAINRASRRGYDDLLFAGFSFDGLAQGVIQDDPDSAVRCHMFHIRPDMVTSMKGLLKETPGGQLFTVVSSPRVRLERDGNGRYVAYMEGMDVYNPVTNTLQSTGADKVAAWFLDTDYDGGTFCITQAFFPDKSAWEKIGRALKGSLEEGALEPFAGKVSLPFEAGKHRRAAIKVIDPRGNEALTLLDLPGAGV